MKTIIGSFLILMLASFTAHGQTTSKRPWLLSQGAAAREAKRFTLQEWLEGKERRNMMDMWLSINTPSPYEFVISGSLQNYNLETTSAGLVTTEAKSVYTGDLSAYATFVGATLEHTNNQPENFSDLTGIFNLRVFGNTVQGSHLTLHYGLRTRTAQNYRLNQAFPGITLQIYLMKFFGIQGNYRDFGTFTESFYGATTANEVTYGTFIEYGDLRIFGDIYKEQQTSVLNTVETKYRRDGARLGLKFFF